MGRSKWGKSCYCYTCRRSFDPMGIARHRKMHRDREEDCEICYTSGKIFRHCYAKVGKP